VDFCAGQVGLAAEMLEEMHDFGGDLLAFLVRLFGVPF
jgi:hypothetical protein